MTTSEADMPAPPQVLLEVCSRSSQDQGRHEEEWLRLVEVILPRLQTEFGRKLRIAWKEPLTPEEPCGTLLYLEGRPLQGWREASGPYTSFSMLRLNIALALLERGSLEQLLGEALRDANRYAPGSRSWQEGLLRWSSGGEQTEEGDPPPSPI